MYADFRTKSCFKNAVCSITSNLFIDLHLYTNKMGGQFTSTLAGNRTVCLINGQRHSFTTYSTGKIILTNLFFLNDLSSVYSFFLSLFVTLIKEGIAHLESEPLESRKRVQARTLKVNFLIENCQFSFQILPILFKKKYIYTNLNDVYCESTNKNSLVSVRNYLYSVLSNKHTFLKKPGLISSPDDMPIRDHVLRKNFPADLLRFTILRNISCDEFLSVKSSASRKRNKDNFKGQNISIHIFPNGKMIITGMQTKEDLNPIFDTMIALIFYFL